MGSALEEFLIGRRHDWSILVAGRHGVPEQRVELGTVLAVDAAGILAHTGPAGHLALWPWSQILRVDISPHAPEENAL